MRSAAFEVEWTGDDRGAGLPEWTPARLCNFTPEPERKITFYLETEATLSRNQSKFLKELLKFL